MLPPLLYKYVNEERIDILKFKRIRFTQPKFLNDPFEGKPSLRIADCPFEQAELDYKAHEPTIKKMYEESDKKMPYEMFAFSFRRVFTTAQFSNPEINEQSREAASAFEVKKVLENCAVLSLSTNQDSLLMWAHYANNHKGMCLGFDSEHSFFRARKDKINAGEHIIGQVKYSPVKPRQMQHFYTVKDLLYFKSNEWSYELEWRLIRQVSDAIQEIEIDAEKILLYDLPPKCLKEIYIGAAADPSLSRNLTNLTQNHDWSHLNIFQANIKRDTYDLQFKQLNAKS